MAGDSSTCDLCGAQLVDGRGPARRPRYCSNACRQRAYRQRSAASAPAAVLLATQDRFVGREQELSDLSRLVRQARLLTVVGGPGIGKTRLVWELVAGVHRSFTDGVHLVELAAVADAGAVARAFAASMSRDEGRDGSTAGTLAAAVANRKILLVVDNCEHVVSSVGPLAEELLRLCPRLVILATSRQPLGVPGESVYRLDGLGLPAQGDVSVDDCLVSDAVRLFAERAQASAPAFALTSDNAEQVAAVCTRLAGMPLAIELAARMARPIPIAEILARLDDGMFAMTANARASDKRHRSLHAAIEWSYDLLEKNEQKAFRRLSVLCGGFGFDAAVVVCGDDDLTADAVPDIVLALETKSLITRAPGQAGPARFHIVEPIRRYGLEQLSGDDEEGTTHERLVEWLSDLVRPSLDHAVSDDTRTQLRRESANLTQALRWLRSTADERQLLLSGGLAIGEIYHGSPAEASALLTRSLESTDPRSAYRGFALACGSWLAVSRGDHNRAKAFALEGIELERVWNRPIILARLYLSAALALKDLGETENLASLLQESVRASRASGDGVAMAASLNNLAWTLIVADQLEAAGELVDEALSAMRAANDQVRLGKVLHTAGVIALGRGDPALAEEHFTASLRCPRASDHDAAYAVEGLGIAAVRTGRFDRGLCLLAAAARVRQEPGQLPWWLRIWWRDCLDASIAAARDALPGPQADAAVATGSALRLPEILRFAVDGETPTRDMSAAASLSPLGQHEREVADLVAQGLTNRQIAGRLNKSLRTVEAHVRDVRVKLGLRSRAQVAAWAAAHSDVTPTNQ